MFEQFHHLTAQFINLRDREKQILEEALTFKQVPKNFLLVREGQVAREVYFINKGLMRLFYDKGGEYITGFIFRENLFAGSYDSFLQQLPSIQNLETLEDCELLALTKEKMDELYERIPSFNVLTRKIAEPRFINAPKERVFTILTDLKNYEKWNPFIVKSSGKIAEGARLVNSMRSGESTITFKPRVVKVVENETFEWLGSLFVKGLFDGHHYFHIEEIAPEQINLIHGETFSGILASLILKKIGQQTRENFVAMNQALKALAEEKQIIA